MTRKLPLENDGLKNKKEKYNERLFWIGLIVLLLEAVLGIVGIISFLTESKFDFLMFFLPLFPITKYYLFLLRK